MKRITLIFALFTLIVLPQVANAQWSADPLLNLSIADRTSEQVIPKLAATPDGGCYVAWFDLSAGSYQVYLQRLNALGNEQWPHNGILVSAHPQNSWLVDWDLIADQNGNAVLTFVDIRAGSDWDVYAYRIAPDGDFLWGADGIALSDNNDFEAAPNVTETADGEFVVVWSRGPDVGDGDIRMQRIAPDGTLLLAAGGLPVAAEAGKSPSFCDLAPAGPDGVIVTWIRDTRYYYSDRHLRAERFEADGSSNWGAPVEVYNQVSVPMGYQHEIQSDGAGGAVLLWHSALTSTFNSYVQHLDASGAELWPHNGMSVSTLAGMNHISPSFSHDAATGDTYVFWDERNSGQSQWGLFGQRFDAAGNRLWGTNGMEFLPTSTLNVSTIRVLPAPSGAMVFWIDEPTGYGSDRVRGLRVDDLGDLAWGLTPVEVATTPSIKSRLPVSSTPAGSALMVWEDDRAGTVDVYGQSVNPDGSLGVATGLPATPLAALPLAAHPNPFNPKTTLRFELSAAGRARLDIYDAGGRHVASLLDDVLQAGPQQLLWDGCRDDGSPLPSGAYLARLRAWDRTSSEKLLLLK